MIKNKTKKSIPLMMIFLISIFLICGCSGQTGVKDEKVSAKSKENLAAPKPPENVSRDKYDMQLSLDTDAKTISGSIKVSLTNTSQDTWSQLCFRDYIAAIGQTFDEMNGSTISNLSGEFTGIFDASTKEALEIYRKETDPSVLFTMLNSPLEPGESMEVVFDYKASIPENAFRYRYAAVNDGKDLLFELANFYPILAVYENGDWQQDSFYYEGECFYSKCADYSVRLTLPEDYTVAASGSEEKSSPVNGLCTWTITAENMRDIGITASNYLAVKENSFGNTKIKCYYFDNEAGEKQANLMLDTATASSEFYTQNIGGNPYPTLDVVMTNDLIGAIEFPSYVRIGDYSSEIEGDNSDYIKNLIAENTAHEVAHQWFYAVVGNNSYQEPWLDESFASFCQLAYQSKDLSGKELETLISPSRSTIQGLDGVYLNLSYGDLSTNYLSTVYEKGKLFLLDLKSLMGEDDFYHMLQEYYTTYAFTEAHTKNFTDMLYKYSDDEAVKDLVKENIKE